MYKIEAVANSSKFILKQDITVAIPQVRMQTSHYAYRIIDCSLFCSQATEEK
jgi:hypothetical protein